MKKKIPTTKKLALDKITIAALDDKTLEKVQGGLAAYTKQSLCMNQCC